MKTRAAVNLALVLAMAILALIGWQGVRNRLATAESERWEDHTHLAIQQFEELLSDLKDVETGQRGFLIAGTQNYLEPYHEALGVMDQKLASLRSLTSDNPPQQQRLAALEPLIRGKLAELKETIDLRAGQGFESARETVMTGRGKALMDQIRRQVAEAKAEERRLLKERTLAKEANLTKAFLTAVIGAIVSCLLLLTAFFLLKREITTRLRVELELRTHRDQLEALVADRTRDLAQQNKDLQRQGEELNQQAEELEQQNEELNQQAEELQQQSEELQQQSEELQAQAEELQVSNQELNERESMLQTLLTALRDVQDERQLLDQVCRAVVQLVGEAAAAAAVVEQVGQQLIVRVHAGAESLRQAQWPFANSFAALVMAQGRTAFIEDLAARPDLIVPEPQGQRFRSLLATPLRIHGQPVGALEVYSFTPRQWTKPQFRIIEWAAAQCALALEAARLQQVQARLAAIVETSEDAIFSKSLDGTILTWNAGAERIFGYRAEEIVGQPITRLLPPELWAEEERILQRLQRGEPVAHSETVRLAKDGRALEVSLTVSPLKDAAGKVIGASKILRDITERKRREEALRQAQAELRQHAARLETTVQERTAKLQELVGELEHFSYSITHDMRAPLRALRGYGEVLEELCGVCPQPEQKLYLRRIMTAAERMDALIRDALNFSQAVRQELPLEPVDAGRLLRGMLDTYPELQPSKAQIRIEGELPVVLANEAGLTQC
ncbi:MAG TPA: CHASE3 domain-containing protein, partial [Bacillota bacterium]|nr:CHASE3 domain-containing protein [Bacillota bacterium]